jgi:hypothetical protein
MPQIGWRNFVVWQCSLRQRNFRMFGGKPSEGISAILLDLKTSTKISTIRSVLIERDCLNTAKMFEFMIKKTHDPEERFSKAVKFFASEYYNTPQNFDGSFTSTFPLNSVLVKKILKNKKCFVEFFERETGFHFPVYISKLKKTDTKWMYTFWHNSFFNSELTNNIDILYFSPEKTRLIRKSKF